ncbi:MAG: GGDEF domain-containing protein [Acidimicrobiia bacterium]|nr:GGDEF domain-containing protein [Acidimicrobiia bacterium]
MDHNPLAVSRNEGSRSADPRSWLAERYLPLAWTSLAITFLIHLGLGGPDEFRADAAFLVLNLIATYLYRQKSNRYVLIHLLGIYTLILWYSLAPDAIPQQLGMSAILFASIVVLPNIVLVSLYGLRAAMVSTGLGVLGVMLLGPSTEELATGLFLVTVSALVGGLFFNRLISALEASEAALARAALTDPLTGFGNRRALALDFYEDRAFVLSLWDLDGLKAINDEFGHARGDEYILEFVHALSQAAGGGCRFYRIGGDEFVGLHDRGVGELAERVRAVFAHVSAGWVHVAGKTLERTLAEADERLYRNKRERTSFYIDLSEPSGRRRDRSSNMSEHDAMDEAS